MNMHRQNGDVTDLRAGEAPVTLRGFAASAVLVTVVVAFVLSMYALAMSADERDARRDLELARAEQQRIDMPAQVRDAYERGMVDAVSAMSEAPDGATLAQTCSVLGARR